MVGPTMSSRRCPSTPAYKENGRLEGGAAERSPAARARGGSCSAIPTSTRWRSEVAAANQDLKIAEARLREARAAVRFNRAASVSDDLDQPRPPASVRESANQPFLIVGREDGPSGDLALLARHVVRGGPVGPGPADGGERPGTRRRPPPPISRRPGSACRPSWRSTTSSCGRPTRSSSSLDETVKAFEAALRLTTNRFEGGARPEVGRGPGPDPARYDPGAGHRHRRPAGAARARDRDPDRQAAGRLQPAAPAARPPAAGHPGGRAVAAPGAPAGHRGRRAAGRGGQRADRHRPRRLLSDRDAERVGRIRGQHVRGICFNASSLPMGGRGVDHPDDLRRRAAARHLGRGACQPTTRRSRATGRPP